MFSELFTIVVDMLAILVHGTLAGELSDKGDENKKVHQSLIRKLKVCVTTCYCIIQCVDKKHTFFVLQYMYCQKLLKHFK